MQAPQELGVQCDDDRGGTHRDRAEGHRQVDAPPEKESRRDGDRHHVVARGPDQVLDHQKRQEGVVGEEGKCRDHAILEQSDPISGPLVQPQKG